LWGELAIVVGAFLALMSWLNVFDVLGSTAVAHVGSAFLMRIDVEFFGAGGRRGRLAVPLIV